MNSTYKNVFKSSSTLSFRRKWKRVACSICSPLLSSEHKKYLLECIFFSKEVYNAQIQSDHQRYERRRLLCHNRFFLISSMCLSLVSSFAIICEQYNHMWSILVSASNTTTCEASLYQRTNNMESASQHAMWYRKVNKGCRFIQLTDGASWTSATLRNTNKVFQRHATCWTFDRQNEQIWTSRNHRLTSSIRVCFVTSSTTYLGFAWLIGRLFW